MRNETKGTFGWNKVGSVVIVAGLLAVSIRLLPGRGFEIREPDLLGPMVQMVQTDGFVLVWTKTGNVPAQVRVTEKDTDRQQTFEVFPLEDRYHALITDLESGAVYEYQIFEPSPDDDETLLPIAGGQVRTAPPRGAPFRFVAFGDSGTGEEPQFQLARQMLRFKPELVIHTGDVVYPYGEPEHYPLKFFAPYADLLPNSVFYPCMGNHEWDSYRGMAYFETFVLPDNGPQNFITGQYYWFDYGDVRFIALDSNDSFRDLKAIVVPWLQEVLASAEERWKVVFFHHPVYTNGLYDYSGKILELIVPVMDRYHVDLVLVGHNHMYERSHPICGGKVVPDGKGTIHITTGAGGANLYQARGPKPDFLAIQINDRYSFTVIDVCVNQLDIRQVCDEGEVIDHFEILKNTPSEDPDEFISS